MLKIYKVHCFLILTFFLSGKINADFCCRSIKDSVQIGDKEQLFLDDYLIKNSTNIIRRMHPAQKYQGNPVIWPTESWENKEAVIYGSVIRDNDKFKMWYLAGGVSYAESLDGINWVKPLLDNVLIDGHKTNILFRTRREIVNQVEIPIPTFVEVFGVHKDDRDNDPSRRYKMGFLSIISNYSGPRADPFHPNERRGVGVAGSPDGIHWKLIDPFATEATCDGGTHWMYDTVRNKYVLYGRTKYTSPEVENAWSGFEWYKKHWGRSVARVESDDFLHWDFTDPASAPVVMTADRLDVPGTEIYSMLVFPYESVYIGLIQIYVPEASYLDIQLAVSHDSYHFTRVGDRKPFIRLGPIGSWDRYNNSLANNPPIAVGDELRFYYGGRLSRHSPYQGKDKGVGAGIGFATIKRSRFISLEASFDGGTVTSKPLVFSGSKLFLNANCRFGTIKVSLLDDKGNEISDWSGNVKGKDDIDIYVPFNQGDIGKFAGQKISLRFTLSNAQLFGFRII